MSRSYKKYPHWTDNGNGGAKIEKRFANKKVRRTPDVPNGGAYKKLYCRWNIHDFSFVDFVPRHLEVPLILIWRNPPEAYYRYETDRDWYRAISK